MHNAKKTKKQNRPDSTEKHARSSFSIQTQESRKTLLLIEKVSMAASSNWSQTDPLSLPLQFQANSNMAAKKRNEKNMTD